MVQRLRPMVAYFGFRARAGVRLEAEQYARHNNGHLIDHHYEWGQPYRRTRPSLVKALRQARNADALLVIPRFESLTRDAVSLKLLWESGVEFVAGDNEHANQTTLPLLASIVIKRSQETSARAKKAWAKRRRRESHGSLGTPENLTQEARLRGGEATRQKHMSFVSERLHEQLLTLRAEGKSLRQIAAILNEQERSETRRPWSHTRVRRLLAYCEETERRRAEWAAKRAATQ